MSAEQSARSVRQADGLDPFVPFNACSTAAPSRTQQRRFHALYDKLARSDVMWRAWVDVATNRAPPASTA